MKTSLRQLLPALMAAALVLAAGCTAQVRDISDTAVATYEGKTLNNTDLEGVIRLAALREGWQQADLVAPGHFVLTKHSDSQRWTASVDVLFGNSSYSIHYKDSQGMRYHPTVNTIAHEYKSQINDLSDRIQEMALTRGTPEQGNDR
jgi:hypothetical protein